MAEIKPLTDVTGVERTYIRLVRTHGAAAPSAKRIDLQPPVADDGETDCWTHAWDIARSTGGTYVEGLCRRPGAGGFSMHAWAEEDSPFGRRIVEGTPGYEDATDYIGIAVDCTPGGDVDRASNPEGDPRSSVIQLCLATGWTVEQTLATVRA